MKNGLLLATWMLTSVGVFGQLAHLPPACAKDGVLVSPLGENRGAAHWESPASLGAYRYASDANLASPYLGAPDDVLGLTWGDSAPGYMAWARGELARTGGTIRAIFVGESAGWRNDFGYSYGSVVDGAESYTVFKGISATQPAPTIAFGDHVDIRLSAEDAEGFDFWFNAVGARNVCRPRHNPYAGGVYSLFDRENSDPYLPESNVHWSQSSLLCNTWMSNRLAFLDVPTYLVGIEDWRMDRGADRDGNDFLVAFQFFGRDGDPLTPVPEPSTYAAGAVALLGLVVWRRTRKQVRP